MTLYPPAVSVSYGIVATAGIPAFFRRLSTGLSARRPDRRRQASRDAPARKLASHLVRAWAWAALLLQAVCVLIALDALAFNVGPTVVGGEYNHLTSPRMSQWSAAVNSGLALRSKDLAISVGRDELTATYTVTAPAGSLLGTRAEADDDSDAGNDLVDNVLGDVTVAEFRYGFTGPQYTPAYLSFQPPTLTISTTKASPKQVIDTVTVQSYPFRLHRHRQQLAVLMPDVADGKPPVQVHVTTSGTEVSNLASLAVRGAVDGSVDLVPGKDFDGSSAMTFNLSEAGSGQSWLDGLRGVGGITIPFLDPLLSRLNNLFIYAVLWWALDAAKRRLAEREIDDGGIAEVAKRVIRAIVLALGAVAGIGFAFDVSSTPSTNPAALEAAIAAGPLGLLVGGAALVWPVACWRWTRATTSAGGEGSAILPWPRRIFPWLIYLAVTVLYWLSLDRHGLNPLTHTWVMVEAVVVLLLVPPLVRRLCGGGGPLTVLAAAGLLAVSLAATLVPALLWQGWEVVPDVSVLGKWAYLVTAVLTAVGLCIVSGQATWVMFRRYRERVSAHVKQRTGELLERLDLRVRIMAWVSVSAVCALIVAAIVPDAVSESAVLDPGARGLVASDLFQLFDASRGLVDWLALYFAILATMLLPTTLGARAAARELAVPLALLLLYWNDSWLYLPVTMTTGLFLVRWLLLPAPLACARRASTGRGTAIRAALAGWRSAEFAGAQRDALGIASTDSLKDALTTEEWTSYPGKLDIINRAQQDLGARQEEFRTAARAAKQAVFSHYGAPLRWRTAMTGTLTGAILGVIPLAINLLTSAPPADGGNYPVLGFLGSTAWTLLTWAGLGWFIGYFLPLIRGGNGVEKGMWLFLVLAIATIPNGLVWNDANDWLSTLVADLQLLVFLVLASVIIGDLQALRKAGFRVQDWVRVHNWRFVATWTTALVTAISTIAITVATTTVTNFSQQQLTRPSAPAKPGSNNAAGANSQSGG